MMTGKKRKRNGHERGKDERVVIRVGVFPRNVKHHSVGGDGGGNSDLASLRVARFFLHHFGCQWLSLSLERLMIGLVTVYAPNTEIS